MWRGVVSRACPFSAPFVWRCLSGSTVLRLLRPPASQKRRGTKSREAAAERYGGFQVGGAFDDGATLGRSDVQARRERAREAEKRLRRRSRGVNGRRALIDGIGSREIAASVEPAQGTGQRRRAEDVWLMTCRTGLGSGATLAHSRVRRPRSRSCGHRSASMGCHSASNIDPQPRPVTF